VLTAIGRWFSQPRVDTSRAARPQYGLVAVPRITKEDLKQQLDAGGSPVIVDARLKYPYEHSTVRLPGAIRYLGPTTAPSLPRDRQIVVYDSDPNELASSHVVAELIRQGYRAAALKGGINEWLGANMPTETKAAPKQAPPEPGALKG
jgi:rhodanese-related sulfurtransferase